jgi:lysophospholipase L1-like esterase
LILAKLLAGLLGLVLLTALAASAASGPVYQAPQRYYLALGDSIAYGIQPAKVSARLPPSGFHTGYVDVFAARLRALAPKIRVVNYGCPGESTKTFVNGGCPWLAGGKPLHDAFSGVQLDAAVAFLRTHRGQVSPITLTLWANDVTKLSDACKGNTACIRARAPAALAQFTSRLTSIVGRLRDAAPKAEIILTGAWNDDVAELTQTDPLIRSVDTTIARVAAAGRARFAKTFPVFNPAGNPAREKARICALTFICSEGDGHPTDAGYRAIAAAVLATSSYTHHS